jgi:hypothetical protein
MNRAGLAKPRPIHLIEGMDLLCPTRIRAASNTEHRQNILHVGIFGKEPSGDTLRAEDITRILSKPYSQAVRLTSAMRFRTIILRIAFFNRTSAKLPNRKEVRIMEMKEDMVMMKDGKMMMMKHGEMMLMDMQMTMSDGTKVMMDGTVMMADGTTHRMMEGDAMTMDGRMTTMKDIEGKMENKMEDM